MAAAVGLVPFVLFGAVLEVDAPVYFPGQGIALGGASGVVLGLLVGAGFWPLAHRMGRKLAGAVGLMEVSSWRGALIGTCCGMVAGVFGNPVSHLPAWIGMGCLAGLMSRPISVAVRYIMQGLFQSGLSGGVQRTLSYGISYPAAFAIMCAVGAALTHDSLFFTPGRVTLLFCGPIVGTIHAPMERAMLGFGVGLAASAVVGVAASLAYVAGLA